MLIIATIALVSYRFATNRGWLGPVALVSFVLLYLGRERFHQVEVARSYASGLVARLPLDLADVETILSRSPRRHPDPGRPAHITGRLTDPSGAGSWR